MKKKKKLQKINTQNQKSDVFISFEGEDYGTSSIPSNWDSSASNSNFGRHRSPQIVAKTPVENNDKFAFKFGNQNKLQDEILDDRVKNTIENKVQEQVELAPDLPLLTKADVTQIELIEAMDKYLAYLYAQASILCENAENGKGVEICASQRDETWFKARACRLTSSNFGKIYHRKSFTNMEKCVGGFFKRFNSSKIPALKWGVDNESKAFERYQQSIKKGSKAWECGFWINKTYPWLGGSPDGFMQDQKGYQRTLEIKCPYNGKDLDIDDLFHMRNGNNFFLEENENLKLILNKNHHYYCQVQGVMELVGTNRCDFIVWTTKDFFVTTVYKDQNFIDDMMKKLHMFYHRFLLPNLCRRAKYDAPMPKYMEISEEIYHKRYQN